MARDTSDQTKTKSWNYVFRVLLSFVLTILVLDLIWSNLSNNAEIKSTEHYWQDAFMASVGQQISQSSPAEYDSLATKIGEEIGLQIAIEPLDQLHLSSTEMALQTESTLIDLGGETYLLATLTSENVQVRVGPLAPDSPVWYATAITLCFYALIALLIWVWIRPLIKGLEKLSQATHRFAQNYREPLPELKVKSPVKELATSIESMATDIRSLIQTQIELTGGLSHEIRTPLARIKFALATARAQVGDQNQFQSIEQDVDELEQLVEAMLDYSRLQQTQAVMQRKRLDAKVLLEKLAEKYRWRTSAKISITCAPEETMHADARLIPLAISNLLVNATRYAKDNIKLTFKSNDGTELICVEDDGPGIPKEKREQATQPFKKNACQDDQSDGFGLGLAIVGRIATLHGGEIQLNESTLGGLQVTINWPERDKGF